jgi:hypothetical protein
VSDWYCDSCWELEVEAHPLDKQGRVRPRPQVTRADQVCVHCGDAAPVADRQVVATASAAGTATRRPSPVLLSFRQAAKALGVDRAKTLPGLVKSGAVRTVKGAAGRLKIPQAEIDRVAVEGFGEDVLPRRRRRAPPPSAPVNAAAAIRKIKLPLR